MNKRSRALPLVLLCIICVQTIAGANWDEQFGVPWVYPGGVAAVTLFGDKLVVGGNFTTIGDVAATNLAQWDGIQWTQIGGGVHGGVVNALAVAGDSLFVGGRFIQAGDLAVNNIVRWDGTNWSDLKGGVNRPVFALALDDANLYAGGHEGGPQH